MLNRGRGAPSPIGQSNTNGGQKMSQARRSRAAAVALAAIALLALTIAAIASATQTTLRAGDLIVTFGGTVSPKRLPKDEYALVTATAFGKIKTSDGTHPSAFREAVVDFNDVKINVKGFPACQGGQLEARDTKSALQVCGDSVLGEGIAHVEIAFPEQKPIVVTSPLTIFNGGERGGKTTLYFHIFLTVPVPAAIVTTVTIQKKGAGLHAIAKIPVAAGGSGSALDFSFKIGKTFSYKGKRVGYFEARCPTGAFGVAAKALFKNEAQVPGVAPTTTLQGKLSVPCTPKG
jgi:hypothetical protein